MHRPISFHHPVVKVSLILILVLEVQRPTTIPRIRLPFAFVGAPVVIEHAAFAFAFAVFPVSFVEVTVAILIIAQPRTSPMLYIIRHAPLPHIQVRGRLRIKASIFTLSKRFIEVSQRVLKWFERFPQTDQVLVVVHSVGDYRVRHYMPYLCCDSTGYYFTRFCRLFE